MGLSFATPQLVYAIGTLEPRFPGLGVEREYGQLVRAESAGRPAIDQLLEVVSRAENLYLAHQLCWALVTHAGEVSVTTSAGVDVDDLLNAAAPGRLAFVSGHGHAGGCLGDGLEVTPVQLLTFTKGEFVANLVNAVSEAREEMDEPLVGDVFERFVRRAGNHGLSLDSRAVNYLALRSPAVYALVTDQAAQGANLVAIDTDHTHTSGRAIVAVRFVFRSRRTDLLSWYSTRVDVTEVFPFLDAPLQQSFDG